MPIEAFRAQVPESEIDDLRRRLDQVRLPDQLPDSGWSYGTPRDVLEEWIAYWRDIFDWRAVEARFNAFEQGLAEAEAEGERVHFVHARSSVPDAMALLDVCGVSVSDIGSVSY